ncbi:extracellular glycoprotein lacritin isoform X3 [Ailuropoda melanoleuca]|uniref:extracellular glycoprotein lacritin isoform X3 n=1 Tax=Ailuropoda melanoleuca TaxID=9646 RepID=UPI00059B04B5|nr:extracellular glycoprotein lacritin isoform X3 [Ailuropoda melanoleuca]
MRFSALLFLAALAGALVNAEGASSDPTPGAAAAEPKVTTSAAKPASPQEPAQEPHGAAPSTEELNPLRHGLEEAKKALHKGVQFGKRLYKGGADVGQNLKNLRAKLNVVGV